MMNGHIDSLINQYKLKGVLVDTNILVLLFVGSVNLQRISTFNRTENFIPKDYEILVEFLGYFSKIVTTPNILTEVNSLTSKIKEPERSQCFSKLAEALSTEALILSKQVLIQLDEYYIASSVATKINGFNRFGLTDCSILELAQNNSYLVLTDDLKLAVHLIGLGIDVINFNHLRNI